MANEQNLRKDDIMSVELKIEYLPVDALKPYEKNARKHTDADGKTFVAVIDMLMDGVKSYGIKRTC